jgi:hypothetical protein
MELNFGDWTSLKRLSFRDLLGVFSFENGQILRNLEELDINSIKDPHFLVERAKMPKLRIFTFKDLLLFATLRKLSRHISSIEELHTTKWFRWPQPIDYKPINYSLAARWFPNLKKITYIHSTYMNPCSKIEEILIRNSSSIPI